MYERKVVCYRREDVGLLVTHLENLMCSFEITREGKKIII
jgi:hypothetical protein